MLPNRTGVPVGLALFALTWKPVPGVEKTAPRGLFTLKKLAGRAFGADCASGTPSQLISRRTPPNDPFSPAVVPPPRSALNWSTVGWIAAALAPTAVRTTGAADAVPGVIAAIATAIRSRPPRRTAT